jgi:hypothetical protein
MAFLNNLTSRSSTARHRPMNRPVLTVEIGRLSREKERALNRLAQHSRRVLKPWQKAPEARSRTDRLTIQC